MAKSKFYVVWIGRKPGIYETWEACQEQTNGFPDAKFKSFGSREEAEHALANGWTKDNKSSSPVTVDASKTLDGVDLDSLSVDAACSGNPGVVEYKGVNTRTGEVLFAVGPIAKGTNNMGEFLALVHALSYLKKMDSKMTIYSDSQTALAWLRDRKVGSKLERDESTKEIWALVDRALNWIQHNEYENRVLKWDTVKHGEIKADFGRK